MLKRLVLLAFALCLTALGLVSVGSSTPARACSSPNPNHCWGKANWTSNTHGARVTINVDCIWSPDGGGDGFITDEVWVAGDGGWIESGMIYGYGSDSRYWFWADSRPEWGFTFHPKYTRPDNLDDDYEISIYHEGNTSPNWFVDQDGIPIGTSVDQFTGHSIRLDTGSETDRNTSRTDSVSKVMKWAGASGNFNLSWEDGADGLLERPECPRRPGNSSPSLVPALLWSQRWL